MPRESASSLQVAPPPALRNLPEPPAGLTELQSSLWHQIVATKTADWWDNSNLPMLRALVVHESAAQVIDQQINSFPADQLYTDEGLARYEKLSKVRGVHTGYITSLMTKMRLSQQSRYGARQSDTAARKSPSGRTWQPAK